MTAPPRNRLIESFGWGCWPLGGPTAIAKYWAGWSPACVSCGERAALDLSSGAAFAFGKILTEGLSGRAVSPGPEAAAQVASPRS